MPNSRWKTGLMALVLTSAFGAFMPPVVLAAPGPQQAPPQALTDAQRKAMLQQGTDFGNSALGSAAQNTVQGQEASGPKGAGCTVINGKCVDNEEIMGRGYDQTKVDRAGAVDGTMESLRQFHNDEGATARTNDGASGMAYRTTEDSANAKAVGMRAVAETDWSVTRQAQKDGINGNAGDMSLPQCTTTTTVTPGNNPDANTKEQHVCEIVHAPSGDGTEVTCTRERVPTGEQDTEHAYTEAYLGAPAGQNETFCSRTTTMDPHPTSTPYTQNNELDFPQESGGLSCTRERWVEMVPKNTPKEKTAALNVNGEQGGLSCSRTIVPASSASTTEQDLTTNLPIDGQQPGNLCKRSVWPGTGGATSETGTQNAQLGVNQESGGLSCTRTVWPETGSGTQPQSQDATLQIDARTNGNVCVREAWPSTGGASQVPGSTSKSVTAPARGASRNYTLPVSAYLPQGTTDVTNFTLTVSNPQPGITVTLLQPPSQANGFVLSFRITVGSGAPTNPAPIRLVASWTAIVGGSTSMSVKDTGNCSETSSGSCAVQWACAASAPQTINGIVVTAAMAAEVAPLFPGAGQSCVRGSLDRTCAGTSTTDTPVSIAASIPTGTTAISDFAFTVSNPQSGVVVSLVSAPTLANSWTATFRVARSDWSTQPAAPSIHMTWNTAAPSSSTSTVESGNCADPGSAFCPTSWSCAHPAPYTVNGVEVTSAMAATQAPLFPGAESSCVVGELNRVCSGTATVNTNISIAANIPAGVTTIRDFAFTVTNPQSGVVVSLVSAPTQANSWMASFSVARDASVTSPASPMITMTWGMDVPSGPAVSVQDTGDCSATGSPQCPATWSCETDAPTTINGTTVTTAMAAQVAPLYPGASSVCAVASLDKLCGGSVETPASVSIATKLPPGTTAISNFAFTVNNPQSGVTVANTQVPSSANGWVALFTVTRTDFNSPKDAPSITLSWQAQVAATTMSVQDTGDCSDTGSASCPTAWTCTSTAPVDVGGITITGEMATTMSPLFPGAPPTCVTGELSRTCQGSATVSTNIGIGDLIPIGALGISDFAYTVLNPQSGVTVSLVEAPTQANGWVAAFSVTRTEWGTTPADPQVKLTFTVNEQEPVFSLRDSGDCGDAGTPSCPAAWSCTNSAPTTINGINVTPEMVSPLSPVFPGATTVCVAGALNRTCTGTATSQTTLSIAAQIPDGTDAIADFAWTYTNPHPALTVSLVQTPSKDNSWQAIFSVTRDYATGGDVPPKPQVTLSWTVNGTVYSAGTQDNGDCSERQAALPPKAGNGLLARAARKVARLTLEDALALIKVCHDPEDPGCDGSGGGGSYPPGNPPPEEPPPPPPAGDACEVRWVCTKALPAEVDGIPVTQAMLDARGPLYPGDGPPPYCLEAIYERQCGGSGAGGVTEVSIADKLRPGTETISNYTWSLVEPGAGVAVASIQDPSKANNWIAKFVVTRTDFNVTPVSPKVRLEWDQPGEVIYTFPVEETGTCVDGPGDDFCRITWACEDKLPPPEHPVIVCSHIQTPWYSGATATFGSPGEKHFDLQSFIPDGTRAIQGYKYVVQTNVNGCTINTTPFPPQASAMQVTQTTEAMAAGLNCAPLVRFEWDNMCDDPNWTPPPAPPGGYDDPPPGGDAQPLTSLTPEQRFIATYHRVANALFRPAMAIMACKGPECDDYPGGGWNGNGGPGPLPPLYPGDNDPSTCMKAVQTKDCSGIWIGTECWIDADGNEHCETVPEGTPPNNECMQYEQDPQCHLVRTECTEGAMAPDGTCYVQSLLYECVRPVPGGASDPKVEEHTVCTQGPNTLAADCMDGSCKHEETESAGSLSQAGAKMMILQHIIHDVWRPGDPITSWSPPAVNSIASAEQPRSLGAALMAMSGVDTAHAQSTPPPQQSDAFALPPGVTSADQYGVPGQGGMPGMSLSAQDIRFFAGKKLDCMKALGGIFSCCKKRPPVDQSPDLWTAIKKVLAQSNNAVGRNASAGQGAGSFVDLIQGAGQQTLQQSFTSDLQSLMGGGSGGPTNTNSTIGHAYGEFMTHENTEVKPKLAWYCDSDEFELAVGNQTGTCTYLGSFCQTKVLGMCVIKKDRYCCFNSPVSRVIREHLDQKGISDLGTAKHPQCEGITIEQVQAMNLDDIATNEIEGRMAQGKYNIDIASLQNMSFSDISSLIDGANSILGDSTRQNPEQRNQSYINATDPSGAYGSIMADQSTYKPTAPAPAVATPGSVGLSAVERTIGRGVPLVLTVDRVGTAGPAIVRVWTENGSATAGSDYVPIDTSVSFANGEGGKKQVLIKSITTSNPAPRESFTVKIEVVSGDAVVSGNATTTIWLEEVK